VAPQGDHQDEVAADLDGDIRAGENQALLAERVGQRGRHHQAADHGRGDQQLYRRPLRVKPVGCPRRAGPDPPQGEQQHQGLERAVPREILDQYAGELGEREDERQVEEEFQERGPLRIPGAAQPFARRTRRHRLARSVGFAAG
jgi:hypothetical protein